MAREISRNLPILPELVRRDLKSRNADSHFGMLWTFAQPLAIMFVMWSVLNYGLKPVGTGGGPERAMWLFVGMIAWNFINDGVVSAAGSIREYSFLVKKVHFGVSILPIMKLSSALWTHGIFLLLLGAFLIASGVQPAWAWIQLPYFVFAGACLVAGLGWLFSALAAFAKDIANGLIISLQIAFWATPVFWPKAAVPERFQALLSFNPAHYIVDGYRAALLENRWAITENPSATVFYWAFCLGLLFFGTTVFKRLSPQFADVL